MTKRIIRLILAAMTKICWQTIRSNVRLIIGLILAIAAIAVIVIAAIRHNTYTSMIEPAATEMPAPEKTGQKKPAPEPLRPDSLTAAKPDTVRQTGGHAGPEQ